MVRRDTPPITACILAGGLGTRLRPLTDALPKPMVPVAGRPFLWHQLSALARAGVRDLVLAVSYKADVIQDYFGDGAGFGWTIRYAHEESPLGTGGALANALPLLPERFLVLNGDTYLDLDWAAFLDDPWFDAGLDGCVAARRVEDTAPYGEIVLAPDGRNVATFREKVASQGAGLVNAGLYALHRRTLEGRTGAFSLERDVLPTLRLAAHPTDGAFVDIGVFDRLDAFRARMEAALP
jgi:NDP-sugar pyrophosphorylase family protein